MNISRSRSGLRRLPLALTVLAAGLAMAACAASAPGPSPDVPVRTPLLTDAQRTILDQPVAYPTDAPAKVSSGIVQLQPGHETGWHRHDTPLYVHVLAGTITVHYDGDVVKSYSTGDTFIEAIGTYHNGRNESGAPVRLLTVSMGAEGYQDTAARP